MSLRSRRWVASSILLMAFLVAIVFFLLFSAFGSQLVWNQLVRVVPDLKGELVSGSLADGWQVHDLKWQNKVSITISQIPFIIDNIGQRLHWIHKLIIYKRLLYGPYTTVFLIIIPLLNKPKRSDKEYCTNNYYFNI